MFQEDNRRPYANNEYYANNYKGVLIGADRFEYYARWATTLVDQVTFGRLMKIPNVPDCVRDAVCAVAEKYFSYRQAAERDIKSESNDGYSVSYADTKKEREMVCECVSEINTHLSNTGLCFKGYSRVYDHTGE